MALLRAIGRAIGAVGRGLEESRYQLHYGKDWREQAEFLQTMRDMEEQGAAMKLAGEAQRQKLALDAAERAKQGFELDRVHSALKLAEITGASANLGGLDTAGLEGSTLMGPPEPGAAEAVSGALQLPESLGLDPQTQALARAVGAGTAVRTTEERRSKKGREQRADADAELRRKYAEEDQGFQREAAAQRRTAFGERNNKPPKAKLTETQLLTEGRRRAGARPNPLDYGGLESPEYKAARAEYEQTVKDEIKALREEYGGGPTGGGISDFDREIDPNGPALATAPAPPKVGTIKRGYRFKGGNPADPKSWEKAK